MTQYNNLKAYNEEHGHCDVSRYDLSNKSLGNWVNKQRTAYRRRKAGLKSAMTEERIQLLERLKFKWGVSNDNAWIVQYNALKEYRKEHGHANVSRHDLSNKRLGKWVSNQREAYRQHKAGLKSGMSMTEKRIQLLEDLEFNWN